LCMSAFLRRERWRLLGVVKWRVRAFPVWCDSVARLAPGVQVREAAAARRRAAADAAATALLSDPRLMERLLSDEALLQCRSPPSERAPLL